eukprot:Gb_41430 [translate_table: standard]
MCLLCRVYMWLLCKYKGGLLQSKESFWLPLKIEAREPTRKESPKVRNRRLRKKFNGSARKPRLSVFCSGKHLYAQLIDDTKKRRLFFASTLQASIRGSPPCSVVDAAQRVGEEVIKACIEQDITKVSIDRNGFGRGERMDAFQIAIRQHGFLP